MSTVDVRHDAVVLAGGRGSRLGGVDKPALQLGGRLLGERALDAVPDARSIALVSHSPFPLAGRRVLVVGEHPRWAGPVAALETGLRALEADAAPLTVVLAADLIAPAAGVAELLVRARDVVAGEESVDGVIGVDPGGRRQPLLAVYRTRALRAALATVGGPADRRTGRGVSLRSVLELLELVELPLPWATCADIDTRADAERHGIAIPGAGGIP